MLALKARKSNLRSWGWISHGCMYPPGVGIHAEEGKWKEVKGPQREVWSGHTVAVRVER
jgi:hypothetical protein